MAYEAHWFEYDWNIEGHEAYFVVDMTLPNVPRNGRTTLVYVSCEAKKNDAQALSSFEIGRAETVLKKLIKALSPLYAGFIEFGAQRQYYLYCKELADLEKAEEIAAREPFLICRAGAQEEAHWATYVKLLYPDAAKLQTEENRKHIALLKEHGDNANASRRIVLYLFFLTEQTMMLFAEQARLSGFAVGNPVYTPENNLAYGISLVRITTMNKREVDEITTRAIRIAEKFDGELSYWDAQVMRK